MSKRVICCLTRGYPYPQMYERLINRNRLIYDKIIKHTTNTDVVLFHEGNIPEPAQEFIKHHSFDMDIKFVKVPFDFPTNIEIPPASMKTFQDGTCYPGYHRMCQFNFCDIWTFVNDYDVVIRIDEDCMLISDNWIEKITEFEESNDVFWTPGYNIGQRDTHDLTNETLPKFLIEKYGNDNMYKSVPCSNFYFTKMNFWKHNDVKEFISCIEQSQGCLKYRWGDHVLIDIVLNMFADDKFSIIKNISYHHGSHNKTITTGEEELKSWMDLSKG